MAWRARVPLRLAEGVARSCRVIPLKHVEEVYGLGWDAVKTIVKAHFFLKIRAAFLRSSG
jgi:hypothetical protein